MVTLVTVAVVTVVIVTSFINNNLTPLQSMKCSRAAFRDSRDVLLVVFCFSWRKKESSLQCTTIADRCKIPSLSFSSDFFSVFFCNIFFFLKIVTTQNQKFGQNSKPQMVTTLKNSNCDKTKKIIVTKLENSNCDKI